MRGLLEIGDIDQHDRYTAAAQALGGAPAAQPGAGGAGFGWTTARTFPLGSMNQAAQEWPMSAIPSVGDRVGRLVLLDPDAARAELVDRGVDVGHAPGHLGLRVGGPDRAQRDRQLGPAAAAEDDPVAGVLAQRSRARGCRGRRSRVASRSVESRIGKTGNSLSMWLRPFLATLYWPPRSVSCRWPVRFGAASSAGSDKFVLQKTLWLVAAG